MRPVAISLYSTVELPEELGSLPEINRRAAEAIYEFFHKPGEGPA